MDLDLENVIRQALGDALAAGCDHMVQTMLAVQATEIVDNTTAESEAVVTKLQNLQKRLKYGLASTSAVTFYELGFADRVVSTDMSQISPEASMRREGIDAIRRSEELAREKINRYPSYFEMILNGLLA